MGRHGAIGDLRPSQVREQGRFTKPSNTPISNATKPASAINVLTSLANHI